MAESTNTPASVPPKKKKERSPAYPYVSLKKAVERAKEFADAEGKHGKYPVRVQVAVKHWGFSEKSSGGLQTIAALKLFGLMEDVAGGPDRHVKLTDAAVRIVGDERDVSPERDRLIKAAALKPKIHAELFARWGTELPSHESFRTYLKLDKGFTEVALEDFIQQYKDTLAYAKLADSDKMASHSTLPEGTDDTSEEEIMEQINEGVPPKPTGQKRELGSTGSGLPADADWLSLEVPYRGTKMFIRVAVQGEALSRKHIQKAIKHLDLASEDMDDDPTN